MTMRHEADFTSTTCACETCRANCRHLSGMISVTDVQRWYTEQGPGMLAWAMEHLAASPGARAMQNGVIFRIPTLVPRRESSGRCHWLSADERCTVYETAPFGCRFFHCTMSQAEGDRRSSHALKAIMDDWTHDGLYSRLWHLLALEGQTVAAPEIARQHMQDAGRQAPPGSSRAEEPPSRS